MLSLRKAQISSAISKTACIVMKMKKTRPVHTLNIDKSYHQLLYNSAPLTILEIFSSYAVFAKTQPHKTSVW